MDNILSSFGGIRNLKNNSGNEAIDAGNAKEIKIDHDELTIAMSSPADGEYYIRSVTKDRYLDVAYEKKEDNAQIIGQTLNGSPSANQRWTVKRISKLGFNLPVVRVIRPVHDPARYLSVHENGDDVVSHSQESEWIAMPTPDGHFKIRPIDNTKLLSVHNSTDWNVFLADDEEQTPKKYHQQWTFVENPYAK